MTEYEGNREALEAAWVEFNSIENAINAFSNRIDSAIGHVSSITKNKITVVFNHNCWTTRLANEKMAGLKFTLASIVCVLAKNLTSFISDRY